jgi:hypothetical protein
MEKTNAKKIANEMLAGISEMKMSKIGPRDQAMLSSEN